jgi:spore germination protein D
MLKQLAIITVVTLMLTACASNTNPGQMQSYKETKAMVLDILKTEEAKKVIEEAAQAKTKNSDEMKIRQMLASDQGQQIQLAVRQVLTDPQYPTVLRTMMTDPKFAGEFAKAVQKENKQLHKELMKDPEYQTMMIEIMKNPEFEELIMDILKSKAYRQQTMSIIQDSLQNPLFRMEMLELMKKALEEESKPKKEGQQGGGEGGEGGGGAGGNVGGGG